LDVQRQDSPSLTSEGPLNVDGNSISGQERRRALQRALADELQLSRLQADVLVRLDEADQAGDNEAVLVCHAELDHVMTRMAEAEHVRVGAGATPADENDLICAGCGAAAEPQYETPRLLGYRCSSCDWVGDDPTAEADRRRAEAKDAACSAVERAIESIGEVLAILGHRGKKARDEGVAALSVLRDDLTAVDGRLRRTQ
jgi:hypothetical protein